MNETHLKKNKNLWGTKVTNGPSWYCILKKTAHKSRETWKKQPTHTGALCVCAFPCVPWFVGCFP